MLSGYKSYIPRVSSNYQYSYSKHSNTPSNYNQYFNSITQRTYKPLRLYFKPKGVYKINYSSKYGTTYYDGYGFDFYYGGHDYY